MIFSGIGIIDSRRTVVTPLGYFFLGGNFTSYKGNTRNRLVKLDTLGNEVSGFSIGTGFNGAVNVVREDVDGKIYVGGSFTQYQGASANRIVRLNADGTRDFSFTVSTGYNSTVTDIKIIDGLVYVAGDFTSYRGSTTLRISRLNTNGSISLSYTSAFGTSTLVSPFLGVKSIISFQTSILCGGNFVSFNNINVGPVLLMNKTGTRNTGFASSFEVNGQDIYKLISLPGNKVLRIGTGQLNSDPDYSTVRLNSNGTLDTFWIKFINGTAVSGLADTSGNYYFGGSFNSFYSVGTPTLTSIPPGLVKTNSSGVRDTSFSLGTGFNGSVNDIILQNGLLFACGSFTSFNGNSRNRVLSLNLNGSINNVFDIGSGFNGDCNFIGK